MLAQAPGGRTGRSRYAAPVTHPQIAPLGFLVGHWVGDGVGTYPTIQPFAYREVVTIDALPTPALAYSQRTTDAATGQPRHAEHGFFRLVDGIPELVVCQSTGIVEAHAGTLDERRLDLRSAAVAMTPSASPHEVVVVRRIIELVGDILRYELHMAAVGQPLQRHLQAELQRA